MKVRRVVKVILFICILIFLVAAVMNPEDMRMNTAWCLLCVLQLRIEFMQEQIDGLWDIEKAKLEFLEAVIGKENKLE